MNHQSLRQIKCAPGKCKLRVLETETRDAIVTDTGMSGVTIAYVAIGAEDWGPLLAAAPEILEALRKTEALIYDHLHILRGCEAGRISEEARAIIARVAP